MNRNVSVEVCILGAGPVGGTLACRLAKAGIPVALIERAALPPMESPAFDGRAYAIAAGSQALLAEAGIWNLLEIQPNPIRDIRVTDGRVGRPVSRLHLHFDSRGDQSDPVPFGWMVEARTLRQALNARFRTQPGLRLFAPASGHVARTSEGAEVELNDGTLIRARLVVAAEGRNSPLRDQIGIQVTRFTYRQTAIVCAIAHELPHHDLALEHFLPSGPFAVLPMAPSKDVGGRPAENVSAIVWTEADDVAAALMRLDDKRLAREISRRLGSYLGSLQMIGRRWSYPLSAMLVHRYTDERIALAGDAAHGIHPIAGQGLNLGFRDAIDLAELILAATDPGDTNILAAYERRRRPENLQMLAMTDFLDRLFSSNSAFLRLGRDTGIGCVDHIGPLKRQFVRRAMGAAA